MRKSFLFGSLAGLFFVSVMTFGLFGSADAQKGPAANNPKAKGNNATTKQGSISYGPQAFSSLKGRVYSAWADNPDGEISFGIQYWNTSEPGETGDPLGRASDDRDVRIPDPLTVCCSWGFTGGDENNQSYAGWYNPQTTVRLAVKDKSLMKQMMQAAQDLVAMEVQVDGRTITSFRIIQ
jgi:hypothetical protein